MGKYSNFFQTTSTNGGWPTQMDQAQSGAKNQKMLGNTAIENRELEAIYPKGKRSSFFV